MEQRISTNIIQAHKYQRNDLMDEKNFIGSHPTRVNLLLCHITAIWIASVFIRMMQNPRIDWQTVQSYIRFHQQDENRDSMWLIDNSKLTILNFIVIHRIDAVIT